VPSEQETVFIIDPDEGIRESLEALLGTLAISTLSYPDVEAFLDSVSDQFPDRGCLIVEAALAGLGSLALLKRLRKEGSTLPVLVLASTSNRDIADLALQAGAAAVIDKPLANGQLLDRLQQLLKCARALK
jgi:two-component system response regulator FixJ